MEKLCFKCGAQGENLYGYIICKACRLKLGLLTDETIKKHVSLYKNSKKNYSYVQEINNRLDFLDKDYIKKRIKLLHVKERLKHI